MSFFDVTPAVEFSMGDGQWRKAFWDEMEESYFEGIRQAAGCYLMVLENRNGKPTPWYAGKTEASFENEIFTPDKMRKYTAAHEYHPSHKSKIILYPLLTSEQMRFAKPKSDLIDWLENRLILHSLNANSKLINVSMTKSDRGVEVIGFNAHRKRRGRKYVEEDYSLVALGLK